MATKTKHKPKSRTESKIPPQAASVKKRVGRSAKVKTKASSATRENTRQAKLIAMLRAPKGATIAQIAKAFGWQPHTVRGALSGALKKKLGLSVTSEKAAGDERVYRIA